MEPLDLAAWERRAIYEYMSTVSQPFYTVCFRLDVTALAAYTHRRGLSFYYALVWLVTKALNQTPAFLVDLAEGQPVRRDARLPSFTDLHPGSEAFHIVNLEPGGELDTFCRAAREKSRAQTVFFADDAPADTAWIYFSCLPWLDLTSITNERDFDRDDTVPRISWGRYTEQDGRKLLGLSVEVNHRFIDGVHIGQLAQRLEAEIAALAKL